MILGAVRGSITLSCKICKHNEYIVPNIRWNDLNGQRETLTFEALWEGGGKACGIRRGASNAYWCPIYKQWFTESSGPDMECCVPDKERALAIVQTRLDREKAKIEFIQESWK